MPELDEPPPKQFPKIAIVGPCSSGKSTLGNTLKTLGYPVRQPTQEHSHIPHLWRHFSQPDYLIYLDVDYKNARLRRPHIDGGPQRLVNQHQMLADAYQHRHFYLDTSQLTPQEVKTAVLHFLHSQVTAA